MAGRPKQRRVREELESRAVIELGEGATALEYVVDVLENGGTFEDLSRDLSATMREKISRTLTSRTAHALSPDATQAIEAAMREGASALAEQTLTIARDAEPTTGSVQQAKLQIATHTWLAERRHPEKWGPKPAVQVMSIGQLHLAALMKHSLPARPPDLSSEVVDAEVVEAESEPIIRE